jgi:hypothetical protein
VRTINNPYRFAVMADEAGRLHRLSGKRSRFAIGTRDV